MKKILPYLGKLLVLCIFLFAIHLLLRELRHYQLSSIVQSFRQIPVRHLALSFIIMLFSYFILMGYDWLALKAIHKKLPLRKVAFVSFIGQVVSYNFGALLGGTTVRYRLYSSWGFSTLDIMRLVLMLAVTFWVGALGLAGMIFLLVPIDVPPELGLSNDIIQPLGAFLVGLMLLYLLVCYCAKSRPLIIMRKEFHLPSLHIALAQTLVAWADLIVAAACLFILLPKGDLTFWEFMPGYLMAQVAVVLTHVPGGVGVLEVVIRHLTPDVSFQAIIAALLTFRVIYYLIPLLVAAILLGLFEIHMHRDNIFAFLKHFVPNVRVKKAPPHSEAQSINSPESPLNPAPPANPQNP